MQLKKLNFQSEKSSCQFGLPLDNETNTDEETVKRKLYFFVFKSEKKS